MKTPSTSWGGVAEWYDDLLSEDTDSYQQQVILPNMLRIAEPRARTTILDLACGQGFFSRAYAAAGAKVIGCDISIELIEKAQAQKVAGGHVEYYVSPADNLSIIENGSVDVVTCTLALQNIENLAGIFAEVSRVLRPGGRFVFVINHPSFRIPKRSSWEEKDAHMYRRVDGYMSDARMEIDMTPGEKSTTKKKSTISFHRPLQSYIKALSKSGFVVTRLEEWISHKKSQSGPRAIEEDRVRKEIPLFMCIEARVG